MIFTFREMVREKGVDSTNSADWVLSHIVHTWPQIQTHVHIRVPMCACACTCTHTLFKSFYCMQEVKLGVEYLGRMLFVNKDLNTFIWWTSSLHVCSIRENWQVGKEERQLGKFDNLQKERLWIIANIYFLIPYKGLFMFDQWLSPNSFLV